ncbi:MAG: methyltransferase domain-containing protein [Nitrospirae bacterium]|nr:MAG: methyltransferase domain-containing protein [Nitrospirota bacterium]
MNARRDLTRIDRQPFVIRSHAVPEPTTFFRGSHPPPSGLIPTLIKASGATWNGHIHARSLTTVTVTCKGLPPVSPAQRASLRWDTPLGCIEFGACIATVCSDPDVRMTTTIIFAFGDLDEFTRHRLQRAWQHSAMARRMHLHVSVRPTDHPETLIDMLNERAGGSQALDPRHEPPPVCDPTTRIHPAHHIRIKPAPQIQVAEPLSRVHQEKPSIVSREVLVRNRHGERIVGFWDSAPTMIREGAPVAIVASAYGETKRDSLSLAYHLAANGFHVIRYDHTNHVGESDGDHIMTTLSRMHDDLQDVWGWASQHFPAHPTVVIATSLAGRVALKASRTARCHPELLVLINPVVDMRRTLQAVHQEDLLGDYQQGKPRGITNVLGLNVDGQRWLADAHREGYTDLETTILDGQQLSSPIIVFSSEHDVWVSSRDVSRLTTAVGSRLYGWFMMPGGLHRLVENPRLARLVYAHVVQRCRVMFQGLPSTSPLMEPDQRQLGKQKRLERLRGRLGLIPSDLTQFWNEYLAHFDFVINSHDYRQLLDHIVHLLNPLKSGGRLLDAGCGNGILAAFLLTCSDWFTPTCRSLLSPVRYIGLDFVASALSRARKRIDLLRANTSDHATRNDRADAFRPSFLRADLRSSLAFSNHTFDAVVANLVLGYLADQQHFIRECLRVLKPGGTLIVTNLKPHSDLSRIYCNFVQRTRKPEDIEEARHLLSNAGKIREAEGDGVFQFPDKEELRRLLQSASPGAPVQVFTTFANQAYVAVLQKPDLAHPRTSSPFWEQAA